MLPKETLFSIHIQRGLRFIRIRHGVTDRGGGRCFLIEDLSGATKLWGKANDKIGLDEKATNFL